MSKVWLVKRGKGWLPADEEADTLHAKMNIAECAEFRVVRPRSVPWHRMYFALCRTIGRNQDPPRDEDSIDMEIRVLSGHYDVLPMGGGYEVRVPKRIAFEKMEADAWAAYFQKAEVAIAERFGPEYLAQITLRAA